MSKKLIMALCGVGAAVVIAGAGLWLALSGADKYIGTVSDKETGEPIVGVSVSDGRNVVKTDESGAFTLKGYRKTRFITVTTPADYQSNDYYIPVAEETKTYDFKLKKRAVRTDAHTFLQVSDTEINEKGVGEWIDHVKGLTDELKPEFLIHTGDICYEAGLKQHYTDMNSENMGVDVKYIIGNHDYVKGEYGEALYESIYGPVWYSFDVGNVHYVITPFQTGGDYKSGYHKNDRWRWLENDLANTDPDKKVVIFNHTNFPGDSNYVIKFDRKELDLKQHNLAAWIFGHYHYNFINEANGVLNISTARPDCGGIDQSASGSRLVRVAEDSSISTQMYYYDMPAGANQQPAGSKWSTQLEGNVLFCDTLTVGSQVFTATVDDDYPRDCGVYSLNADTGAVEWYYETENSIKNNLAYDNGKVIAQDCEGRVYCLDGKTGTLLWKQQAALPVPGNTSLGIYAADGRVYTGSGTQVTAIDIASGSIVWTSKSAGGENSPASLQMAGDKLIVSSQWNALYALDKNTGKQLWLLKDEKLRFRSATPYCMEDGKLLVAAVDAVFLIDGQNGTVLSKTVLDGYNFEVTARPLVIGSTAYLCTADQGVLAFDLNSLTALWKFETKKDMVYTSPYSKGEDKTVEGTIQLQNNQLVFGASDGYFYKLNQDGSLAEETFVGAPVFSAVGLYGDDVIVSDFSGRVSCMR